VTAKILIVDDDEFVRTLTQDVLEQVGYSIETVGDGAEAWKKIDREPDLFDLILLDKRMPGMDGIALLKRIKADARLNELPVILLTGDSEQEDILEGLAEGAFYYLTKPSTEHVLKLVVRNALEDLRQKRELRGLIGKQANNLTLLYRAEFRFRTLSEARDLALLLADASMDAARTVNGYAELLINAVEHGNLGITYAEKGRLMREDRWEVEVEERLQHPRYSARTVHVALEKTAAVISVIITDQGEGFDWQAYVDFSPERVFDLHGRGIAMSKALSFDSMEYLGCGNRVIATVRLPGAGETSRTAR
jgi:CheY-like chemotaxis protein/anti-sigma regulatory factor (Ser/Thr protein kinase)